MTATLPLTVPADVAPAGLPESAEPPAGTSRPSRIVRGRPSDPAWVRPSLLLLLLATAALYLWDLGASGWANTFYSAAVQAGTKSWEAFFFGSSDASNFITVDKPPASLWVMELSARLFGVNAWSILVPQALEGVAAVGVLYATVRRWFSPAAALLAGAVLALTPVATLMFRFNNPDALLVLLLVAAAYAMTRAVEKAGTRWLLLAGALVGFGFITKMMQAFLVVPVFALVYLVAAPTPLRRRIGQLLLAGVALVVASGWWVAVVELVPSSARPYIGGSQDNSVLSLILGYNGLGRLTGNETGSVVGGAAGAAGAAGGTGTGMWGATGWSRLFGSEFGGQVAWLIPAALVSFVGLLWMTRRAPRTDRLRASVLLWGGWLIVTGLTFSFAQGIIHPYYAVALAPAIAALVGIGAATFFRSRHLPFARAALAIGLVATSVLAYVLLDRSPDWNPWLRYAVVVGGVGAAAVLLAGHTLTRRVALSAAAVGVVVSLAAPAAYSLETAATPHSGSIPSAGPSISGVGRPLVALAVLAVLRVQPAEARLLRAPRRRAVRRSAVRRPAAMPEASAACSTAARPAQPSSRPSRPTRPGTPGQRPRSAPTPPRATSWRPASRSCPSAGSTGPIRRPPWRSSSGTSPRARSTTSSPGAARVAAAVRAAAAARTPSQRGSRRTTPRPRSAARRSTT